MLGSIKINYLITFFMQHMNGMCNFEMTNKHDFFLLFCYPRHLYQMPKSFAYYVHTFANI